MSSFVDKLRLKERVEEDLYFAKQDRRLIRALHRKKLAKIAKCPDEKGKGRAEAFEERFEEISTKHKKKRHKLLRAYRALLDDIKGVCKRRRKD